MRTSICNKVGFYFKSLKSGIAPRLEDSIMGNGVLSEDVLFALVSREGINEYLFNR